MKTKNHSKVTYITYKLSAQTYVQYLAQILIWFRREIHRRLFGHCQLFMGCITEPIREISSFFFILLNSRTWVVMESVLKSVPFSSSGTLLFTIRLFSIVFMFRSVWLVVFITERRKWWLRVQRKRRIESWLWTSRICRSRN